MLWIIHAEDKPGSVELRQATRADHLAYMAGQPIEVGGPMLDDAGAMVGSLVVVDLPDREAVEAMVAGDPYTKAGLFERVSIHAWRRTAGRSAIGEGAERAGA